MNSDLMVSMPAGSTNHGDSNRAPRYMPPILMPKEFVAH
jgi:hypothetical protein